MTKYGERRPCPYCKRETLWVPVLADDWTRGWWECWQCGEKEEKV